MARVGLVLAWLGSVLTAASVRAEIPNEGLRGRLLCGYQGWFAAEGDGAEIGWRHWKQADRENPAEQRLTIDLLPDVSELPAADRFPLGVVDAAGRPVEVFSSYREATVRLHFQ